MYSDFVIPKFDEVVPGGSRTGTYSIDCKGSCKDLNFVDINFYIIVEQGNYFHDLFQELPDLGRSVGLNAGHSQERFYSYVETETVSFTLVPTKS